MTIKNRNIPQYIAAAAATMGGFGLGTVLGWSSPSIPNLQKSEDLGILSDSDKSWIGSLVAVGASLGAPIAGYCINRIGRKMSLLALTIPLILGWIFIASIPNLYMMFTGRFLNGVAVGALSVAVPVYISEISDDSVRGTLGTAFTLMFSLGILFTFVIGSYVSWRILAGICSIIPILFFVGMIFVPETPRFYLMKGKYTEATKSLSWLRASKNYLNPPKEITIELENMKASVERAAEESATLKDIFKTSNIKPIIIVLCLMFFNQFCGSNAVGFYTTEIFEHSGAGLDADISTIIVGIVQVIANVGASALVDKAGRRILLMLSFAIMSISLVCLGIYFHLKRDESFDLDTVAWLPLTSVVTFNIGYYIGLGPLVWAIMSELLPSKIIGLTTAVATTFNWALAFVVTRFFHDLLSALGIEWCFWLFAISCAAGFLFVLVWVPETKGKSLEEIQEHFND